MNKLKIGSDTYEVAEWYGVCSTAAATQAKTVSISGFGSDQLVDGVKVTVLFSNAQSYNGSPTLNVSSTGAKQVIAGGSYSGKGEWTSSQEVTFVYYNGYWNIEDGTHADITFYGKTKLSNTIADDATMALTPKAVYDAGFLTLADLPVWDGSVT